jgi:hypothetical protein
MKIESMPAKHVYQFDHLDQPCQLSFTGARRLN